jgi:hypothetical protein
MSVYLRLRVQLFTKGAVDNLSTLSDIVTWHWTGIDNPHVHGRAIEERCGIHYSENDEEEDDEAEESRPDVEGDAEREASDGHDGWEGATGMEARGTRYLGRLKSSVP